LIDLHTHTNRSDGTDSPENLVRAAQAAGLRAIAITDHDTFDGYWAAHEAAKDAGLELVCGIEISTRHDGRSLHLLAYFLDQEPTKPFLDWLYLVQKARKERNRQMAKQLQSLGLDICLEEAESLGKSVTGRLHFARAMVSKEIVDSVEKAFDQYLTEGAPGYVRMDEPLVTDAIRAVREAGALPVLAHPLRLGYRNLLEEEQVLRDLRQAGLLGLECYHADHSAPVAARYLGLARKYAFCVTGGSDYHGAAKPNIRLGSGVRSNVRVPYAILNGMRSLHEHALRQVPA
jgi:3',5'-nucleoside bisphosphate phosphatase